MDSYFSRTSSGSTLNPTSRDPPADPDAWMRSRNPVSRPLYPSIVAWPYLHGNPFDRPIDPHYYSPRFIPQLPAPRELNPQERRSFQEMMSIFELNRLTQNFPTRGMTPQPGNLDPNAGQVRKANNDDLPAYRMPPEILEQIFMDFLEDGEQAILQPSRPLVSRKCPEDPLILGQVCSYWRSVALATPALWCRIVLINPTGCTAVLAHIWLERAGTRPLELTLEEKVDSKNDFFVRKTLTLFGQRRQYWKDVHFQITGTSLAGLFSFGIDPPFAYLQSFSVSLLDVPSDFDHDHAARQFSGLWRRLYECPSLRRLHWAGPSLNGLQTTRGLWNNVTDLTLDFSLTLEEGLELLSRSPMLEVVSPFRFSSLGLVQVSSPPISCANLHTLSIASTVDTESLFASITLPALRNLYLRQSDHANATSNRPQLEGFFLRSECQLQRLTLADSAISEDTVKSLLRLPALDNLLGLRLSMTVTDNLVGFLTLNNRHRFEGPLSLLENLHLAACDTTTDGMLAQMILSRWSSGEKRNLKKLMVYKVYGSSYGLSDSFTLARVFAEGLEGSYG